MIFKRHGLLEAKKRIVFQIVFVAIRKFLSSNNYFKMRINLCFFTCFQPVRVFL